MKKLYYSIIAMLFTCALSFGQGSEDFTNSAATATYADGSFVGNGGITWTYTHSRNEGDYAINGNGLMLRRADEPSSLSATFSGGIGNFSVNTRKAFTGNAQRRLELVVNGNVVGQFEPTFADGADATIVPFVLENINIPGEVTITLRLFGANGNQQITLDDIVWTGYEGTAQPALLITSPSNNAVIAPLSDVTVNFNVSNFVVGTPGDGIDGHIHYILNGGNEVMIYNTNPIVFEGLASGEYTLEMFLVDNNHQPLDPAVSATVNFEIAALNVVADLAAVRADVIANGAGAYYQISSTPLVTYTRTNRNQKYIQDADGAILIDDVAGIITTTFEIGDVMENLAGRTTLFNGLLQLVPIQDADVQSSGNDVTPTIVTIEAIQQNLQSYESRLVQINGVTFTSADGEAVFANATNYPISDGTEAGEFMFRTLFTEADYIGQVIPENENAMAVLVANFNGTGQVVARNLQDFALSTPQFNAIAGLSIYPNPMKDNTLNITSELMGAKNIVVFDVLGKEVFKTATSNDTININGLRTGVYIIKITQEGKTATRKLVVQ